jgi:hypothetical protein
VKAKPGLLEGDYPDGRRLARFHDMREFASRKAELQRLVKQWLVTLDLGLDQSSSRFTRSYGLLLRFGLHNNSWMTATRKSCLICPESKMSAVTAFIGG